MPDDRKKCKKCEKLFTGGGDFCIDCSTSRFTGGADRDMSDLIERSKDTGYQKAQFKSGDYFSHHGLRGPNSGR